MTSIIHSLKDNYKDWKKGYNDEIDSWLLMDGPGVILVILTIYLTFVLKIGPSIMKNRQAMELKKTIILYNAIQVLLSIYLVYKYQREDRCIQRVKQKASASGFSDGYDVVDKRRSDRTENKSEDPYRYIFEANILVKFLTWLSFVCSLIDYPLKSMFSSACSQKMNKQQKNLEIAGWWYFIAKVTELLDTVFFVLRKRARQISFLHVYHHSNMVFFTWCFLKYSPSIQGGVVGGLNSTVHVVMYTYYMITAMGPKYQKYVWWKKYMTVMQLVQFCIIIGYFILLLFTNCGQSRGVTYFFILNAMIFLYLFTDFYRKSYNGDNKRMSKKDVAEKPILENKVVTKSYENGAYAQISRDAELLSQDTNLRKRE